MSRKKSFSVLCKVNGKRGPAFFLGGNRALLFPADNKKMLVLLYDHDFSEHEQVTKAVEVKIFSGNHTTIGGEEIARISGDRLFLKRQTSQDFWFVLFS